MSALAVPAPAAWLDWPWPSHRGQSTGPTSSWLTRPPAAARPSRSLSESLGQGEMAVPTGGSEQVQKFQYLDQIERFRGLLAGWDTYNAPAPSSAAISSARTVLEALFDLGQIPVAVAPMVDGGIELVLMVRPRYASIEADQDGDILLGFSDRKGQHNIWQTALAPSELRASILRLRKLMYG